MEANLVLVAEAAATFLDGEGDAQTGHGGGSGAGEGVLAACEPTRNTTYLLNYNMIFEQQSYRARRGSDARQHYAPATANSEHRVTGPQGRRVTILEERLLN